MTLRIKELTSLRVGFAASQAAYQESVEQLFSTLDSIEQILERKKFLLGDEPCEADWRILPTLIRFDTVYYYHFKCNLRKLSSYTNIKLFRKSFQDQKLELSTTVTLLIIIIYHI